MCLPKGPPKFRTPNKGMYHSKQRETLTTDITKAGERWPLPNSELANKYTKLFQKFVNSINFEDL
jgi:hypothetical protein